MFAKLRERRGHGLRHYVDNGVVWCPVRQADVDIEKCFECHDLEKMAEADGQPYVQCNPLDRVVAETFYGVSRPGCDDRQR